MRTSWRCSGPNGSSRREFWRDHLRPLGFGLKAEVFEYPRGMPSGIGFILTL